MTSVSLEKLTYWFRRQLKTFSRIKKYATGADKPSQFLILNFYFYTTHPPFSSLSVVVCFIQFSCKHRLCLWMLHACLAPL